MSGSKPKIHLGRDNSDFLGLFLKEIRFKKDSIDFGKTPNAFEDGDPYVIIYTFIYSKRFNE